MLHELGSLIKSLAADLALLDLCCFWCVSSFLVLVKDDGQYLQMKIGMMIVLLSRWICCWCYWWCYEILSWHPATYTHHDNRTCGLELQRLVGSVIRRSKACRQLEVIQHMAACGLMTSIIYCLPIVKLYNLELLAGTITKPYKLELPSPCGRRK